MAYIFEIRHGNRWVETSEYFFRSWGGERRLDGQLYEGPVYLLGTDDVYRPGKEADKCRPIADLLGHES